MVVELIKQYGKRAAIVLGAVALSTTLYFHHPRRIKHTGKVQAVFRDGAMCEWFLNPRQEIFEYCFDNRPVWIDQMFLDDVAYTDDNSWLKHFVNAKIPVRQAEVKK